MSAAISRPILVVMVAIAVVAASVAGTALASFAFPGLHLLRDLHPFQLAHFLRAWL